MKAVIIRVVVALFILALSLVPSTGCDLLSSIEEVPSSGTNTTDNVTAIDPDWVIPFTDSQDTVLPSIADVVAKVKPSVVAINTEIVTIDFFNRQFTQEGAGSGWIIDSNGIIVTNNHVISGAQSITVTLDDGRTFTANTSAVATDPISDIAVLKIDAEDLPAAEIGDSSTLRIGDWVIAIGNSLGQGTRATQGIVSRRDVSLEVSAGQELYGLIETDAAINRGNSGGPLVNLTGEVIGITNAKQWNVNIGIEGVGYAISTDEAMPIIQQLITTGYVVRPWLGVSLYTVDQYVVQRYGLAVDQGSFVVSVSPNSPASQAGISEGDVITRFDGKEITNLSELIRAIHQSHVGQTVEIVFWHGDSRIVTSVTLQESPPPS